MPSPHPDPGSQGVLHAPQWLGSVRVLTQALPQQLLLAPQVSPQFTVPPQPSSRLPQKFAGQSFLVFGVQAASHWPVWVLHVRLAPQVSEQSTVPPQSLSMGPQEFAGQSALVLGVQGAVPSHTPFVQVSPPGQPRLPAVQQAARAMHRLPHCLVPRLQTHVPFLHAPPQHF